MNVEMGESITNESFQQRMRRHLTVPQMLKMPKVQLILSLLIFLIGLRYFLILPLNFIFFFNLL